MNIKAVCFGEVLVDQFPSGDKPGGAPLNVAYHLNNLGSKTAIISSVGSDDVGKSLLHFMENSGIESGFIKVNEKKPTGWVQVDISDKNEAKYTIVENVAWDEIQALEDYNDLSSVDFIVHGSLALRSETNQKTLKELKDNLNAKVVFDLNLRSPFYSKELLINHIKSSSIIKLNDEEFNMIAEWLNIPSEEPGLVHLLKEFEELEMVLVTKGGDGAWVQTKSELIKSRTFKVNVTDTVGSGDSFLGAFINNLIEGNTIRDSLDFACATGAFVASRNGANPSYSKSDILKLF